MPKEFRLDELINDLPELAESAKEEIRNALKAALGGLVRDMDLVYQEEIDTLKQMLTRTEARVSELEDALNRFEQGTSSD